MEDVCIKKKLFGKEIEIILYNTCHTIGEEIAEETYKEGLRLQKIFNFFDKSSELSLLNEKRKLCVSDELKYLISEALKLSKKTDGNYDIALGKLITERKKRKKKIPVKCSYKDISIKKNFVELTHKDVIIDLGSIAKGYISDKLIQFLKSKGVLSAMIDARGDIMLFGRHSEIIEIQHPRNKKKSLYSVKLQNRAIATSGDYNQYIKNFRDCHIINSKNIISATVVAKTLKEADAYATAIFVCNERQRKNILKENPEIKVLLVDKNLRIKNYNGFEKLIVGDIK